MPNKNLLLAEVLTFELLCSQLVEVVTSLLHQSLMQVSHNTNCLTIPAPALILKTTQDSVTVV